MIYMRNRKVWYFGLFFIIKYVFFVLRVRFIVFCYFFISVFV